MAKPNWITITPASGSDNGSFDVETSKNGGHDRNGVITVEGGGITKTINVSQESGILQIKSIQLTGQALRPVTIKQDRRTFKLGGSNPSRVDIPNDVILSNFVVEMQYKSEEIGGGGTNIQFVTNDGISEIIPTGNSNSYINFRANNTGFIIICGNGFPPIPQTSQYIVSFKNSNSDITYYFRFYMI